MNIVLNELIEEFNVARKEGVESLLLNQLANKIQTYNMESYGANTPFAGRRKQVTDFELDKWKRLEKYIKPNKSIKLFDTAFGSGRDLLIAEQLGYDVFGCELSEYLYKNFLIENEHFSGKLLQCDMREIPFPNESFHIIRHNASFLHMPVIGLGFTAHKCLTESYRLLKDEGLIYLYLKEGHGFTAIDTGDALGYRSFQLYDEDLIIKLLSECGFVVECINHYIRPRNSTKIKWIEVFAKKQRAVNVC